MADSPEVEGVVVAVCWADFEGNECASSLAAVMTVKALEEAWWG